MGFYSCLGLELENLLTALTNKRFRITFLQMEDTFNQGVQTLETV
jgi:hypothetical protein